MNIDGFKKWMLVPGIGLLAGNVRAGPLVLGLLNAGSDISEGTFWKKYGFTILWGAGGAAMAFWECFKQSEKFGQGVLKVLYYGGLALVAAVLLWAVFIWKP